MIHNEHSSFGWGSHLERRFFSSQQRWYRWTFSISLFLFLLAVATYLLGQDSLDRRNIWLRNLELPVLVMFVLGAYPLLLRWFGQATSALYECLVEPESFVATVPRYATTLRGEVLAFVVGAVLGLCLFQPWKWGMIWRTPYLFLGEMILFGMIGWTLYFLYCSIRLLKHLHDQPTSLNIFDTELLKPLADWSLALTFLLVGLVSLGALFAPGEHTRADYLVVYILAVFVEVFVFSSSMWTTHRFIKERKRMRLREVHHQLELIREQMMQVDMFDSPEQHTLSESCRAFLAMEKRIKDTPEWPYTLSTLRHLSISILLPFVVGYGNYLFRLFTGQ